MRLAKNVYQQLANGDTLNGISFLMIAAPGCSSYHSNYEGNSRTACGVLSSAVPQQPQVLRCRSVLVVVMVVWVVEVVVVIYGVGLAVGVRGSGGCL